VEGKDGDGIESAAENHHGHPVDEHETDFLLRPGFRVDGIANLMNAQLIILTEIPGRPRSLYFFSSSHIVMFDFDLWN
jgi:hypothetical protein